MRLTHLRSWLAATFLAIVLGGMAWSYAPRPEESGALLHPAESIIYFAFDGGDAHEAAFKKTAAYAAVYESGLIDSLAVAAGRLKESAEGNVPERERAMLGKLLELGKHAVDRGMSFSLVVQPPAGGPPTVSSTLIINQAASYRSLIEDVLREGLANEPKIQIEPYSEGGKVVGLTLSGEEGPMGGKATLFEKSGHLVVNAASTFNGESPARNLSFQAIDQKGKSVSAHRLFKDGAAESSFVQNGIGWLDFQPLKAMFGGMPLPPTPSGEMLTVHDLLQLLGIDTLEALVSRSGYRDRAAWTEVSLIAPGPRKGLMALLDQPTFTIDELPALPVRPFTIAATSVDAGGVYDLLVGLFRDISKKVEPRAIEQFDEGLAQVEAQLGFSIRNDFLGPLKGVMLFAADGGGSQSFDALQISLGVADADRFRTALSKIFDLAGQVSEGEVTFETVSKHGRDMSVMRIRQAPIVVPTLCIDGNYVHLGLLPQAVEMVLLRTDGKLPKWKPEGDTVDGLKLMPGRMTAFSYSDAPMMYGRMIGQAPILLGFVQAGMAQLNPAVEFPLRAEDLPPAEVVSSALFPNIAVSTVDAEGAKSYSRTSLPGSEMLVSVAGLGVGTALVLPAVQSARDAARRTESKNNIKQILLGLHNYHDVHNSFPAGTVPNAALKPEERLSWLAAILPYVNQAAVYSQIDMNSAWNKGANEAAAAATDVELYLHPKAAKGNPGATNYVGLAGVGEEGPTLDARNPKAGMFAYDKGRHIRDVTDGTSNTAMVVETSEVAPWAQGGRGTIRPLTTAPYINGPDGLGGVTPGGANVGMADGSVRFVNENIDPKVMEALTTIAGGEIVNDF